MQFGDDVIIDVHAHLYPQSAVRAENAGREWYGSTFEPVGDDRPPVMHTMGRRIALGASQHRQVPEQRIAAMDRMGVTKQIISLVPPLYRYDLDPPTAINAARDINDEIAGMVKDYPDRFGGLATLPLQDVAASLAELERVMAMGLSGFAIGTHVAGVDLDAAALRPIFRAASDARAFVLCHPAVQRDAGTLGRFYLSNVIGNPLETTIAFASLVLGGVLDDAPNMQLCLVHGGGYVAAAAGRLDHASRVRPETTGARHPISHYLRSIYVDSLTHDPGALRALVEAVGADRVLMGSDYPADMSCDRPVGFVLDAGLDEMTARAVLSGNAARIFD